MKGTGTVKRAIVVGASSGIGREVALLLAAEGWTVGVASRRTEMLEKVRLESAHRTRQESAPTAASPGMVSAFIDVTAADASERLLSLIAALGGIDLLFYASGIGNKNIELDETVEMATVQTNAVGFTRMVGTAYRYMATHGGGHIAVVSSIAGTKGLGAAPSYSATKSFQSTYIQALEQQARMRGLPIRFTDIRPGFVATALLGDGAGYPMLMDVSVVARDIVRSINAGRHVRIIDRRWRLLTFFWRHIPDGLWRRITWAK